MEVSADLRVGCRRGTGLLPPELPIARPALRALLLASKPLPQRAAAPESSSQSWCGGGAAAEDTVGGVGPWKERLGPKAGQSWSLRLPQPRIRVAPAAAGPGREGAGLGACLSILSFLGLLQRRLVQRQCGSARPRAAAKDPSP